LFENNIKGKKREKDSKNRLYKSLAEVLKGKSGRFRNNLLGKRVDYSGRSVIISGPELHLHQCGLPRRISLTLFQNFLIRYLIGRIQKGKKILTRSQARKFLHRQNDPPLNRRGITIAALAVLLNRAPTLHRFGFQAFQPQLSFGRAVQIHPLVCGGFNADFDGDQISIHVPVSPHSRAESLRLIIPGSHLFSPAIGDPMFLPSQDIILGIYLLTAQRPTFLLSKSFSHLPGFSKDFEFFTNGKELKSGNIFFQQARILQGYEKGTLKIYHSVWLCMVEKKIFDCEQDSVLHEGSIHRQGKEQKYSIWYWKTKIPEFHLFFTTVGRVLFSSLFARYSKLKLYRLFFFS
jgi:DNA-directed RNA polymerase beta' subunit